MPTSALGAWEEDGQGKVSTLGELTFPTAEERGAVSKKINKQEPECQEERQMGRVLESAWQSPGVAESRGSDI